ncbi:MAG: diguanylate cyclase [Actinomycetota bacterium]
MSDQPVVLVADDSAVVRRVVASQLAGQGFRVVEAEDGDAALKAFADERPDIVLLDVEMPGRDGFEVLAAIKHDPDEGDTPVVFLTAREDGEALVDALERGAHDYLRKPFDANELLARVRAAYRVKALQDELRLRNAELDRVSRTDPLTGLWNRRHLEGQIPERESLARRHGIALSALMIDIDHFKRINDVEGHATGDLVLREIAHRLREGTRPEDVLARWGGEEFLVLMLADAAGAAALGERVRALVAAAPVTSSGRAIEVTVSVGCATRGDDEAIDSMVTRADEALYEAKDAGRNRVVAAG